MDEPSIGLHSKDTENLIEVLKNLRDLGNTVIVVEHDEDVMRAADYIIDIGPEAGYLGGELVFAGDYKDLKKANTLLQNILREDLKLKFRKKEEKEKNGFILKVRVRITLKYRCRRSFGKSGSHFRVSGSGKSTLMKEILTNDIQIQLGMGGKKETMIL